MEEDNSMSHSLELVEIHDAVGLIGISFVNSGTDYIRYQISAPTDERKTWHVIQVVRGGEQPFEFVFLGHEHSRKRAVSVVRQAWVAATLADLTRQAQRRQQNHDD